VPSESRTDYGDPPPLNNGVPKIEERRIRVLHGFTPADRRRSSREETTGIRQNTPTRGYSIKKGQREFEQY
jgi:hypothetical protein